jgi:hypothetical protein
MTKSRVKMVRVDVMMEPAMISASDRVARQCGLTRSAWIKQLVALELNQRLGTRWQDEAMWRATDDQQADQG